VSANSVPSMTLLSYYFRLQPEMRLGSYLPNSNFNGNSGNQKN